MKMGPLLHITHHRRLWRHPHYQHRSAIKVVSDEVGYHHRLKPSLKMVITVGSFYGPTIIIIKKWKKALVEPIGPVPSSDPIYTGQGAGKLRSRWPSMEKGQGHRIGCSSLATTGGNVALHRCRRGKALRYWKPHALLKASCLVFW